MATNRVGVLALLFVFLAAAGNASGDAPAFPATRTPTPPRIDGHLEDEVWSLATPITGFVQQEPDTGKPATERTIVKVLHDDDSIYFAAWLYDSRPVTAKLARRDSFLPADWFAVYLDTHHDHRSARMFRVNPSGVQRDSLLEDTDDEITSWDAVWYAAARITTEGWTAEIRIPYSQLRFPSLDTHVWGINFHREISRNNEYTRLVHVPRNETGFVSRFAHLTGIRGITPPRRLEVLPYVVTRARLDGAVDPQNPLVEGTEGEADAGLDVKYGLSSNLTLSVTLNPDFGQVEVDPAEVNLSEFELSFDERRPFFLEGADLFAFTGIPLFYSRRVGRIPQGAPAGDFDYVRRPTETTILGAAKLSGRTATGWSLGILNAVTAEESAHLVLDGVRRKSVVEPRTNYFAGRISRDFGDDTRVAAMLTSVHRRNPAHLDFLHDSAWTAGTDGYRFFGRRDYALRWALFGSRVNGSEAAITRTQRSASRYYQRPDAKHIELDPTRTSLSGWGGDVFFAKQTGKWQYGARTTANSPGLEINDAGFRTRVDTITGAFSGTYVDPQPRGRIRSRNSTVAWAHRYNFDGDHTLDRWFGSGGVVFSNYWSANYSWSNTRRYIDDRLTRGGPLGVQPRLSSGSVEFATDPRKPVAVEIEFQRDSGELDAYRREMEVELTWRPRTNLMVQFEPIFARWRDPLQFVTRVADPLATATYGARYVFAPVERREIELATRLDWAISRSLTVQLYMQPFVSSGDYIRFRELARPSSLDYHDYDDVAFDAASNRYTIDPDGDGTAQPFTIRNPDFNLRSMRGNLVTRWEFRPGSSVYVVWSQNRSATIDIGTLDFSRDLRALTDLPEDDVFLVKVSYWFGL